MQNKNSDLGIVPVFESANGWREKKRIRRNAAKKKLQESGKPKTKVNNVVEKKEDHSVYVFVPTYTDSQKSHYKRTLRNRAKKLGISTSEYKKLFITKDVKLEDQEQPVTKKWYEIEGKIIYK